MSLDALRAKPHPSTRFALGEVGFGSLSAAAIRLIAIESFLERLEKALAQSITVIEVVPLRPKCPHVGLRLDELQCSVANVEMSFRLPGLWSSGSNRRSKIRPALLEPRVHQSR